MTESQVVPVPVRSLFVISTIFILVAVLFGIAVLNDGGSISVHGFSGLAFLLFVLTALVTGMLELVVIGVSIRSMLRARTLRTKRNIVAVAFGSIPIVAILLAFLGGKGSM